MKFYSLSIDEARKAIDRGDISPVKLTEAIFERIDAVEGRIHSFVTINRDNAMAQAIEAEQQGRKEVHHLLSGIPLAIKDNICTKGVRTTCCSKILHRQKVKLDNIIDD